MAIIACITEKYCFLFNRTIVQIAQLKDHEVQTRAGQHIDYSLHICNDFASNIKLCKRIAIMLLCIKYLLLIVQQNAKQKLDSLNLIKILNNTYIFFQILLKIYIK